jgi:BirA family biotin operon repressor/biotin-[acetyl-CoA-carboxylase] ligase
MRTNYWNRLYQRLAQSWYSDQNGRFQATITGVEPDGRLVMTDSDGRERRYAFKEVQFVL